MIGTRMKVRTGRTIEWREGGARGAQLISSETHEQPRRPASGNSPGPMEVMSHGFLVLVLTADEALPSNRDEE